MKTPALVFSCLVLCAGMALATQNTRSRPRIVLVGDSTVTDDSGWGAGFARIARGADVVNTAANGRSSKSFIDKGAGRRQSKRAAMTT